MGMCAQPLLSHFCTGALLHIFAFQHVEESRIWEICKEDAKKEYPSLVAAAKAMGYNSVTTVYRILKNNTYNNWCGEYI